MAFLRKYTAVRRVVMRRWSARSGFRLGALFVVALLVGVAASFVRPDSAASATLQPERPFVMDFRERSFHGSETLSRLEYTSERVWVLTVLEGGEAAGYYMESNADGSVVAGYPHWDEPHVLSGPTESVTLPAHYFAPRNLDGTAVKLGDADLPRGQTEAIATAIERGALPVADAIVFRTSDEVVVYSNSLGLPIWMAGARSDAGFFEVVSLEHRD